MLETKCRNCGYETCLNLCPSCLANVDTGKHELVDFVSNTVDPDIEILEAKIAEILDKKITSTKTVVIMDGKEYKTKHLETKFALKAIMVEIEKILGGLQQ